jgi:hypothetical protein
MTTPERYSHATKAMVGPFGKYMVSVFLDGTVIGYSVGDTDAQAFERAAKFVEELRSGASQ